MVDLVGFSQFCSQIDGHLAIPELMKSYCDWLFGRIRAISIDRPSEGGAILHAPLPFFAKLLGGAVLFLWCADGDLATEGGLITLATRTTGLGVLYETELLPDLATRIAAPPRTLRCSFARGLVYSIGAGKDYVGPCIEFADRLRNITPGITHCFSRRGMEVDVAPKTVSENFVLKTVSIPGLGDRELVYVLGYEFDRLAEPEKRLFSEP